MIADAERSKLIFSTGKEVYANNGAVGLSPSFVLSEGYDGEILEANLTNAEIRELALYMMGQWEFVYRNPQKTRELL